MNDNLEQRKTHGIYWGGIGLFLMGIAGIIWSVTYVIATVSHIVQMKQFARTAVFTSESTDNTPIRGKGTVADVSQFFGAVGSNSSIREQTLENRIAEAKAILLCKHTRSWGKTKCVITRILKHAPDFNLSYSVGHPIPDHEGKYDQSVEAEDGEITFLTGSSSMPSTSLVVNKGILVANCVDFSRLPNDVRVEKNLTVEKVNQMIETAAKASEGLGSTGSVDYGIRFVGSGLSGTNNLILKVEPRQR